MMIALSHWVYVPIAVYAGMGLFFLRQSLRPSCRVCLRRHCCPNRLRGPDRFTKLPLCVRGPLGSPRQKPKSHLRVPILVQPFSGGTGLALSERSAEKGGFPRRQCV
jgi:hypothetical protein